MSGHRQPLLHDQLPIVAAPSQVWSAPTGDIRAGDLGFIHADTRIVSRLIVRIGGERPDPISGARQSAAVARFAALPRDIDDSEPDPHVRLDRERRVQPGRMTERLVLSSVRDTPVSTRVTVELECDALPMAQFKRGVTADDAQRPDLTVDGAAIRWTRGDTSVEITGSAGLTVEPVGGPGRAVLGWDVVVPPRGRAELAIEVAATVASAVVRAPSASAPWQAPDLQTGDNRLARWVATALDDLDGLRIETTSAPGEQVLAAGAPWFFTLFGRDSIWAARFLLPLGTGIAAGTLRALARLQGTAHDAESAEQPGKIMHELRAETLDLPGDPLSLPPLYYGTVDATALWVCLLHDAWLWGMPDAEVEQLLPHLEAALGWMRDEGARDGFLRYIDTTGHGLSNQGWKDSSDSIQWSDGTLAEGPIALCEVQGYAYEAAVAGARMLDRFGRAGGDDWRKWAAQLKQRFAERFWIDAPESQGGRFPAIALDVHGRPVDTVTSNIGHLLGTGILEPAEAAIVARHLVSERLDSGYGVRTLTTSAAGYWPLSYHGGSVWTHDTAIAIAGLAREGFADEAARLSQGLLTAAEGFGYLLPELHSGDPAADHATPVPYPAACRPQAWSAAAAVSVLQSALGLWPEAPDAPLVPRPLGATLTGSIRARGLRFANAPFDAIVE